MSMRQFPLVLVFALLFTMFSISVFGEAQQAQAVPVSYGPSVAAASGGLGDYDYYIDDGLYATVTANSFEVPKTENETKVKLKPEGFKKEIEVRVVWQAGRKPLAVLMLGLASRAKDKMAQLWKDHLRLAGFNVLMFDSPFLPTFSERSRHGVAGNVVEESRLVASLIAEFMKKGEVRERVTSVGLVGISYGSTISLNIAKMAQEGKCPFTLDRVLAFSPPVKMQTAARHLDRFFREDRWNYTLSQLADDLLGHKPVAKGQPVPFSASEMRAGISAAFRMDLTEIVLFTDSFYKTGALGNDRSSDDGEYKRDMASTWTFERFIADLSYPYWQRQGKAESLDQFWAAGDLTLLLKNCPANVQVVIAADDPLNEPSELEALKGILPPERLTILPRGGHMGYNDTQWVRSRVARLFE